MRRLIMLLPLLLSPLPAQANEAFCAALRRLVDGAQWGFNDIGTAPHLLPGSVAERRGVIQLGEGPARGAIIAIMLRVESREHVAQVTQRFHALQSEIAHCLADAQASPVEQMQGGLVMRWTTPRAVVRLRADDGAGGASTAEVEVVVASRW